MMQAEQISLPVTVGVNQITTATCCKGQQKLSSERLSQSKVKIISDDLSQNVTALYAGQAENLTLKDLFSHKLEF